MQTKETALATSTARKSDSRGSLSKGMRIGAVAGIATGFIVLVPVLILQLSRGVGVVPEMQLAASSLIGMVAYAGLYGLILGTILHFFVSIVPALAYGLIVWHLPFVNRLAWIGGPVLGLVVFFFMGFMVLPHTFFVTPAAITPMPFVPALLIHMFGLGLPIALIVRLGWDRSTLVSH